MSSSSTGLVMKALYHSGAGKVFEKAEEYLIMILTLIGAATVLVVLVWICCQPSGINTVAPSPPAVQDKDREDNYKDHDDPLFYDEYWMTKSGKKIQLDAQCSSLFSKPDRSVRKFKKKDE